MGIKYYIAVKPRTDDFHAIHKGDCPFLNNEEKIFIGSFNSGREAENAGQKIFSNSKSCAFCSKKESTDVTRPLTSLIFEKLIVFDEQVFSGSCSQDLFCSVN